MRVAALAGLLLLAAGCGHERSGPPAAEPPRAASTAATAEPASAPQVPSNPPAEPAAAPAPSATTPVQPTPPPATRATPGGTPQPPPEGASAAGASAPLPDAALPPAPPDGASPTVTATPAAEPVRPSVPEPAATAPGATRGGEPAPPASAPTAALTPFPSAAPEATPEPPAAVPEMDLKALEDQLRRTKAIGFMTKLTLKGQVDDLLDRFREFYQGKSKWTMKELRRSYDLLMMKVLSLLQDEDAQLASAIVASREAIWGLLADPVKFETLQG